MKPDFKIDDLQAMAVFAAVARAGSMSAAARQLGGTPSGVSQRVRALEAAFGVQLLHRSTRRLTLTDTGARLLRHCEAMVAAAEAAREQLHLARDAPQGELRISAPVGFARHVAPALAPLLATHPALRLHLRVDDALIDLVEQRIDLALRAGTLADSAWVARPLCRFEWLLCAAPGYLAAAGVPQRPDDLAGHAWLSPREGALAFTLQGPAGETARVQVQPRCTSNNQLSLQQACVAGLGLALLVRPDAEDDLRAGRLVPVLPGWRREPLPVWAVTPQRHTQPAKVRLAIAALADGLRAVPGVAA